MVGCFTRIELSAAWVGTGDFSGEDDADAEVAGGLFEGGGALGFGGLVDVVEDGGAFDFPAFGKPGKHGFW